MNGSERGFTLLEAMLAILVLMIGVGALAQLNRTMVRSLSPSGDGLLQHAEIVDLLLRDGAEAVRANPNPPLFTMPNLVPNLTMSGATYAVQLTPLATPAAVKGFRRLTYRVEVTYQAPGGAPELAGSLVMDKVTQAVGTKGGL